jgi:hypothetical protein
LSGPPIVNKTCCYPNGLAPGQATATAVAFLFWTER